MEPSGRSAGLQTGGPAGPAGGASSLPFDGPRPVRPGKIEGQTSMSDSLLAVFHVSLTYPGLLLAAESHFLCCLWGH